MIASSRTAFDFFISLKDGATLNLQKAATQRLDALVPVMISTGKILEGTLLGLFESDLSVITEFFPSGRTELRTAKRGDVVGILNRLVDRATAHQAELGAGWVTRLTNLRTQWSTNMALQSGAVSNIVAARSQMDPAWETLAWAFFDIAQQLSVDNPRNAGIADQYFDFSVFTRRQSSNSDHQGFLHVLLMGPDFSPLINATYKVNDMDGNLVTSGTTDGEGKFKVNLPIGFYRVAANQVGYQEGFKQIQVFDDNDPLHEMFLDLA
ncbi:MAG TPA: carboxypeptidase-like regulatory domain-containing protein [Catalimonadaceae bacterium]|nr:carboxypeptidase-like regulatory domain-containing protein [Catalimonadaceae bacterium]